MAEAKNSFNVLITGGAESVGLATARALTQRGHTVVATACDAEGALAVRQVGALPVYPDLSRASEVLSALQWAKADAVVHARPQFYGGAPHASDQYAASSDQLVYMTAAVVEAAVRHGVQRIVSLSFGYLYEAGRGAAKEGDHDVHEDDYAPMLAAESALRESGLNGAIIRSGYIYGGHSAGTTALAQAIKRSQRLPAGAQPASWIHEDDLAAAVAALLESEADAPGVEIMNAADDTPRSPDEFIAAICTALGLNEAAFAGDGILGRLRQKTLRDKLLARALVIDSGKLRNRFGWSPRYSDIASGLDATTMVWRMQDAVNADDYYNKYDDAAAAAIADFAYDAALPEPVAEPATLAATSQTAPAPTEAPVKAAAPPPSEGPTPWNEDEAKREERRQRALERKAKRAAQRAGG